MSNMAFMDVRGISKVYHQGTDAETVALNSVDISIQKGEFVAIVGRSGSGKSTLLHILGCMDRPNEGTYYFDGQSVGELSEKELAAIRNRKIGFVLQEFGLILNQTALENVSIPLYFNPAVSSREMTERAQTALDRVGLTEKAHRMTAELSGGQKQRVAIARAIVNRPALILADEPTGALDKATSDDIMALFRRLNAAGMTVVIVTHDRAIAESCPRIITVTDGMIHR